MPIVVTDHDERRAIGIWKQMVSGPSQIAYALAEERSHAIEECAKVAASFHAFEVADAIRALKDTTK